MNQPDEERARMLRLVQEIHTGNSNNMSIMKEILTYLLLHIHIKLEPHDGR